MKTLIQCIAASLVIALASLAFASTEVFVPKSCKTYSECLKYDQRNECIRVKIHVVGDCELTISNRGGIIGFDDKIKSER